MDDKSLADECLDEMFEYLVPSYPSDIRKSKISKALSGSTSFDAYMRFGNNHIKIYITRPLLTVPGKDNFGEVVMWMRAESTECDRWKRLYRKWKGVLMTDSSSTVYLSDTQKDKMRLAYDMMQL